MSDSLIVTIDTIKKLTYLTKDQQQELYEELVSDIPLSETFSVHGEISADQYMKSLTSQEQQQISTGLEKWRFVRKNSAINRTNSISRE